MDEISYNNSYSYYSCWNNNPFYLFKLLSKKKAEEMMNNNPVMIQSNGVSQYSANSNYIYGQQQIMKPSPYSNADYQNKNNNYINNNMNAYIKPRNVQVVQNGDISSSKTSFEMNQKY